MAIGYFLSAKPFHPNSYWHPCFYSEDLSVREMNVLRDAMERRWGYDDECPDECFEFRVEPSAAEDPVRYVEVRELWLDFQDRGPNAAVYIHEWQLHDSAHKFAEHIAAIRDQIPERHYFLVDQGQGERLFFVTDELTDGEIEVLKDVLVNAFYENGAIFSCVSESECQAPRLVELREESECLEERVAKDEEDGTLWPRYLIKTFIRHLKEARDSRPDWDEAVREWAELLRDEKAPSDQSDKQPFVPSPLQVAILKALDGRALKKEALAGECRIDPARLYRPGGIKELTELGMVRNKRGVGYYRPNAPPDVPGMNGTSDDC